MIVQEVGEKLIRGDYAVTQSACPIPEKRSGEYLEESLGGPCPERTLSLAASHTRSQFTSLARVTD